ncbi:aromatic ring-hydroxylating oxygenase subunit alpha [Streptomyces sp. 4F14]|uniref:aromatic ring-hydroxylating oxygenase subunit alpha n=1 Tax=Streptomyces sp. 4F14 TaxID=3394380 RepID=UPI003A86665E
MSIDKPDLDITSVVNRRAVGHSLEAPFYTSQEIHELDLDVIFGRHWFFCATEAEIPEAGDYVTIDVGPHSVIIVRDDEEVRAFRNVCRHRGSRLLSEPCGSVGNIVCPYHQWTYRTDGSLVFAEYQPPTFDREQFGLRPAHVRTVGGMVFLCLAEEPPADFDEFSEFVEPYLLPYDLKNAKVAHQTDIVEEGNWKLVMENNRECHHCDVSHPELLTAYFPFNRHSEEDVPPRLLPLYERYKAAEAALTATRTTAGFPQQERRELDSRATGFQLFHLPLDGAGASLGTGGEQVCKKLLGSITDPKFGDLSLHMQPNAWFHFLSDHAVVFWVQPLSPGRTLVRTTWLVHPDAVEGVDYDVDALTAVWTATNDEDRALVEGTQCGVANSGYVPGPYSTVEDDVEAFVNWYVQRIRASLPV